ncbi:hypothetical protein BA898_05635 [Spiribacter roseus]|nr:hypothetical protein BA898_05635 [Spiribacter roseus]
MSIVIQRWLGKRPADSLRLQDDADLTEFAERLDTECTNGVAVTKMRREIALLNHSLERFADRCSTGSKVIRKSILG